MITFPRMHVSLYVKDLAQTVDFYNTFFAQRAAKIRKGYAKYELEEPSLIISFIENPDRVRGNFGHLGFQVASKEEMERRLGLARQQQIVSLEEIGTACCFALQDKFWVTDPDGHQWEVYYFHEDVEFNDPHYDTAEATACCAAPESQEVAQTVPLVADLSAKSTAETCTPGSGCC